MTISPDDKDWTWVLERPCPECRFDASSVAADGVAALLRDNTRGWIDVLQGIHDPLSVRPRPDRWSAVEYAAHVRDVHRLYLERLDMMLTEDGPRYPNWDQDETAVAQRYHETEPATVGAELQAASDALADRFDSVRGDDWERTGYRSDGAEFTIASFAIYFVHDPIHHLDDVNRGLHTLRT